MQEGQSWRDGALAMLRPMTGGVVESSEGREIERERERRLGPEQRRVEANQTEPRYKRNEQREKKSETRGRQSAAEPHWRSHALPRDPRPLLPIFVRRQKQRRTLDLDRIFFNPKRVTLEKDIYLPYSFNRFNSRRSCHSYTPRSSTCCANRTVYIRATVQINTLDRYTRTVSLNPRANEWRGRSGTSHCCEK